MFRTTLGALAQTRRRRRNNRILWRDFRDAADVLLVIFKCLICIFQAVHFESFLPLSQMKALLLSLRLFKGKKKPLIKSIRDIFYVLIKLLHVRRSANFTTMLQFYLVIRAGPPFPSLPVTSGGLLHTCWVLLHLRLWQRTHRESCVQGRAPPKRTL